MTEIICGSCGQELNSHFCPDCTDHRASTKADSTHEMIQRYLSGFTDHDSITEVFESLADGTADKGSTDLVHSV